MQTIEARNGVCREYNFKGEITGLGIYLLRKDQVDS
jgi:hypothetical protein